MRRLRFAAFAVVAATFAIAVAPAGASRLADPPAPDDAVVLPSRVSNAIHRAQLLLDASSTAIDTGDSVQALAMLKALPAAITRADKAARAQMNAPVDPNAEEGATPGPDSAVAVLTFEQAAATTLAGLFDGKAGTIVSALTTPLFAVMNTRDKLLKKVIDAGADYADGMADTAAGYDDEVANLAEALNNDTLSTGGRNVLKAALAQSQKAQAAFTAAFGGGE
jgi:hypothetical protein